MRTTGMDTTTPTTADTHTQIDLLTHAICNCKGLSWSEKENLIDLMLKSTNESFQNGYAACKRNNYIPGA